MNRKRFFGFFQMVILKSQIESCFEMNQIDQTLP